MALCFRRLADRWETKKNKLTTIPGLAYDLTEKQYELCKEAIDRYVAADMLTLKVRDVSEKSATVETSENVATESATDEDETELRAKAKEAGIKRWHVKSVDTLTKELEELESKEEGDEA